LPFRPPAIVRPAAFLPAEEETFHGRIYAIHNQLEVKPGVSTTVYVDILNDGMDAAIYLCNMTVYGKTSMKISPTTNPGAVSRLSFTLVTEAKDASVSVSIFSEVG